MRPFRLGTCCLPSKAAAVTFSFGGLSLTCRFPQGFILTLSRMLLTF